jgi:hypothetical protein
MIPDKWYDVTKTVQNVGTIDGWLYIHIKNVLCEEDNDKDLDGDGLITVPEDNPEPENVAQWGGKVGQVYVDGVGERCDMEQHIKVEITLILPDGTLIPIDLSQYDKNGDGEIKLWELECEQILIGQLEQCGEEYGINFNFLLQDVLDPDFPGSYKFEYWPTNAYQGDVVTLDILFELLQTDYEPPQN